MLTKLLLVLFCFVVFLGSCPQGWIGYSGSCYVPYVNGETWQEANETCREMDSHLALSKSITENEFIAVEVARPEARVWIGLKRNQGEFVWSDGSKSEFTNWADREPKDASVTGRDCVTLLSEDIFYSWEVRGCEERQSFICERGESTSFSIDESSGLIFFIGRITLSIAEITIQLISVTKNYYLFTVLRDLSTG